MMRKFTLQIGLLLMAVLTISACSKDEETDDSRQLIEDPNAMSNNKGYNGNEGNAADNGTNNYYALELEMQGEYDGEWSINGQKVNAEDVYDYKTPLMYDGLFISFTRFPYREIALRYGLQDMNLIAQPFEPHITTPCFLIPYELWTSEMNFIYDIHENKDEVTIHYECELCPFLKLVGYSNQILYFDLIEQLFIPYTLNMNNSHSPFFRFPYAVTLDDGSYYAIVLDLLYSQSTLVFDYSTKTVNLVYTISQIELYDQDRNKTIRELNPEMILTFTSTQKTKAGESGD